MNSATNDTVRATLLWQPIDELKITPMIMWQQGNSGAPNAVDVNGSPTNPTYPSPEGHYEIYQTDEPQRDRFTLGSLKVEYALTPDIGITSITALWSNQLPDSQDGTEENRRLGGPRLRDPTSQFPYDAAAGGVGPTGPGPFGPAVEERDYTRQFSEELRVASTGNGPLQWLARILLSGPAIRLGHVVDQSAGRPDLQRLRRLHAADIIQNAAFGNISWTFMQGLTASVGARYYHYSYAQGNTEWGDFTPYGFATCWAAAATVAGNLAAVQHQRGSSANGTNPRFNLTWQIDPNHMVYGTVAKGFRLGGTDQPFVGYNHPETAASCAAPSSLAGPAAVRPADQAVVRPRTTPGDWYTPTRELPQRQRPGRAAVQLGFRVGLRDRHQERAVG